MMPSSPQVGAHPYNDNRRRLPKSKTGCRTCKKRRIKCDEGQPICRNCVKHAVNCVPSTRLPRDRYTSSESSVTPQISSISFGAQNDFSLKDMEILHHYTTSTCLTFSNDPTIRTFWRIDVPQIGFDTPYILNGILALSALHLARFRPQLRQHYISQALHRHNEALNAASQLFADVNDENCVPLFLFSSITNYFAFAKPPERGLAGLPDWFFLFRGVRAVMDIHHDVIRKSLIGGMFETNLATYIYWEAQTYEHEGIALLEANLQLTMQDKPEQLNTLMQTTDALKRSLNLAHHSQKKRSCEAGETFSLSSAAILVDGDVRPVFIWLYKVSDEFIAMVNDGHDEALCVLAYFSVLLHSLNAFWWAEGWGFHLMEKVYSQISFRYRAWIRWPMEEIGWIP